VNRAREEQKKIRLRAEKIELETKALSEAKAKAAAEKAAFLKRCKDEDEAAATVQKQKIAEGRARWEKERAEKLAENERKKPKFSKEQMELG